MAKKRKIRVNKEYELLPCKRKHDWRILACDPGTRNFGIACVGVRDGKIDVIASSLLTNPITVLTAGYLEQRRKYTAELRKWIELYKPDAYIAERFQTRGNGGPTIELVSTMNALLPVLKQKPFKYVVASQWKNAFNKRFDNQLKSMYDDCLTTPHQLDAALIGCYGLELALQTELKYSPESIIEMVEAMSCLELKRRRIK
jgi:Holliday junction resolvasome RuvABC endonuclease subunit